MTARLRDLRDLEVLTAADVHVAEAVARLTGPHHDDALLAIALAVRAPRLGHVCLDLRRLLDVGLAVEGPMRGDLSLPPLHAWLDTIATAPSVRPSDRPDVVAPLVMDGERLYLDRYWRYEQRLVAGIQGLLEPSSWPADPAAAGPHLDLLFPDVADEQQRRAAEIATRERLTVLTGGPGTGKTTTVVRLLAALWLAAGDDPPSIVLTAPTGKAAARLAEAIREQAVTLPVSRSVISGLQQLPTSTLHRLLGWQPGAPTRFRHDARNPLPHDVVVVDEASMASLPLIAKLVDALGPSTRLVLVGDRDQLASVDAGAVLSDICGPRGEAARPGSPAPTAVSRHIVTLNRFHRFGPKSGIGALARAIQRMETSNDATSAEVLGLLRGEWSERGGPDSYSDIGLVEPGGDAAQPLPTSVLDHVVEVYAHAVRAALDDDDPRKILRAFDELRVLTALRRGPDGVDSLVGVLAERLATAVPGYEPHRPFPVGQPVMVTHNDHQARLYNGDVGVVVRDAEGRSRRRVAFPTSDGDVRYLAPARLPAVEPVFAMSVHKSQGSQFGEVVLVLPRRESPLLSRELVYTGVTRAAGKVTLVADPDILTAALGRRVQRASGLTERLWDVVDSRRS